MAKIVHRGPSEVPVAVVDLVNDETRFENNHIRDHRIVDGIGVFDDVEVFLNDPSRIGEEGPVGADSGAKLVRLIDVVGADGDQLAIANLDLTVELNQPLRLAAVLGSITAAAQHQNHRIVALQLGELPAFCGVVGQLVIRKDGSGNDVSAHVKSSRTESIALPFDVSRRGTDFLISREAEDSVSI